MGSTYLNKLIKKQKVNMDSNVIKEIFLSPIVVGIGLYGRILVSALFICGGAQLFDFRKPSSILSSFFTKRRVIGLFL